MANKDDPLLSTVDVGRLLDLTPGGVRRMARSGQLVPDEVTPSGYRLYRLTTVEQFAAEREKRRLRKVALRGRPPRAPSKKVQKKVGTAGQKPPVKKVKTKGKA